MSPLIAKSLLEQGKTVVCIVVGSEESKIAIENTVKTFQSLDTISRRVGKPLVVSYWHNDEINPRAKNDLSIRQTLTALAILASKQNAELDTSDVNNFFNFDRVTSVKEGLSLLYITNSEEEAAKIEHQISVASIMTKEGDVPTKLTPEYSCLGYAKADVLKETDLHFVISQKEVKTIFAKLNDKLNEYNKVIEANTANINLGGNSDDNGMVL